MNIIWVRFYRTYELLKTNVCSGMLIALLILGSLVIYIMVRDNHYTYYSEEKMQNSNLIVTVTNQSFEKPKINAIGYVDDEKFFSDTFRVANQHRVTYFYKSLINGQYSFKVVTTDNIVNSIDIDIDNDKKYVYVSLYEDNIDLRVTDTLMLID